MDHGACMVYVSKDQGRDMGVCLKELILCIVAWSHASRYTATQVTMVRVWNSHWQSAGYGTLLLAQPTKAQKRREKQAAEAASREARIAAEQDAAGGKLCIMQCTSMVIVSIHHPLHHPTSSHQP